MSEPTAESQQAGIDHLLRIAAEQAAATPKEPLAPVRTIPFDAAV